MGIIKVSVIVAAYNSEKYLHKMLASVVLQTLREIEIICVDDGSSDRTLDIFNDFAQKDSRIKVLRHTKKTDGAAEARNLGISHATGEYLSVLDADDYFEIDMLEKVYNKAKNVDADILLYDGWVFDEKLSSDVEAEFILRKKYLPDQELFTPMENADQLFLMTCGAAWNGLFRREFIEEKQIRFRSFHHADDLGFVYLSFACADKIAIMRDKFIHYRKNTGTSQADLVHLYPETCCLALDDLKKLLQKKGLFEEFSVAFGQIVMVYSLFYLDAMKTWHDYEMLYTELRQKWLKKFGVYSIPEFKFKDNYWAVTRNLICELSAGEFIFRRLQENVLRDTLPQLDRIVPLGTSVAIYGAGVLGRNVFSKIIKERKYCLTAWVDQKYQAIGYPVLSPEILKTIVAEWIIVAISSKDVFEQVKDYLVSLGIKENKICWIGGAFY